MQRSLTVVLLAPLTLCCVIGFVYAVDSGETNKSKTPGNSYYLFTKNLTTDESGVIRVPPRFQWSVETSFRGTDRAGDPLPDSRLMLRLFDPDHNFTAMTAQIDLTTAARLHEELGAIIANKLQDPAYQHRPQLYHRKDIPVKRLIGVEQNGTAIVEDVSPPAEITPRKK